jgi:hypothetical protein
MTADEFLFRDGYSINEKISRIPTPRISAETPEINSRLRDISLSESEVGRLGKNDFFEEAEDQLSYSKYRNFISTLFRRYGVKGDKFNMQLFVAEGSLAHGALEARAAEYEEERVDSDFTSLTDPIVLVDSDVEDDYIDLQFRTTAQLEDINPDEKIPIQIIDTETGDTVEQYGPDYHIKAPARYRVETRVYIGTGIIAVSNYSKIKDGLKTNIAETVTEMARGETGSGVGDTHRMDLNETELLLLLQEMEGDISGLGYTLEIAGVDTADFTGQRDEDMMGTDVIRATDEAGQIRKIKFYVDHPGAEPDDDRDVMLRIFDDGHLTTSKPVPVKLLNATVAQIHDIRGYNEFLTPLSELIYSYVGAKFRGKSTTMRNSHISKTNRAFNDLIEEYFERGEIPTEEIRLYKSMIANIGIKLCDEGIPRTTEVSEVSSMDDFHDREGKVEEFFQDYSQRSLDSGGQIDFDELSNHLDHLLKQSWDSPAGIIEHSIDLYDIDR